MRGLTLQPAVADNTEAAAAAAAASHLESVDEVQSELALVGRFADVIGFPASSPSTTTPTRPAQQVPVDGMASLLPVAIDDDAPTKTLSLPESRTVASRLSRLRG